MKKTILLAIIFCTSVLSYSQGVYWVFFTDKAGSQFNPHTYFDSKAIERRLQHGVNLYDSTDFPLNTYYKQKVEILSEEVIGETRWFNAMAVVATSENIQKISQFSFVKEISPIQSQAFLTSNETNHINIDHYLDDLVDSNLKVDKQLKRMGGEFFHEANIDGKGIRIAVFDGGFPSVNKHIAFKHLRDNNQIIRTWNFPLKKENVYGWNSHGTMTLSCIAGIAGNTKIGLATGAEFLLARTEINIEPAKEEVWWMQAMEWADKNGAHIISSSLGYGDARYKVSDMDGKKSLVSKAANMAASKGILVCNSMGNEGTKNTWRTIITPADADSVLAVGGINPKDEKHTSFSSYGPTADGRIKPNVCAYATDCMVAKSCKGDICYNFTHATGTSFSCPLVAGFAACAWQKHPDYNAMELKKAIERSADLYPYYDYAYGYGVPQAAYFLFPKINVLLKTFEIKEEGNYVVIKPFEVNDGDRIFYHIQQKDSTLCIYENLYFTKESENELKIHKSALDENKILRVYFKDYVETYVLETDKKATHNYQTSAHVPNFYTSEYIPRKKNSIYGINATHYVEPYVSWGMVFYNGLPSMKQLIGRIQNVNVGLRYKGNICKSYSLGFAVEYNNIIFKIPSTPTMSKAIKSKSNFHYMNIELYQRIRILPTEGLGMGFYVDIGIFNGLDFLHTYTSAYKIDKKLLITEKYAFKDISFSNFGLRLRLGYNLFIIYTEIMCQNFKEIPKHYNVGLQFSIPTKI
ncbi:MAG: S8 family serine peptidase [Bacteroidales bacterium]|nr:S8 family serine peptidase [Bacteroidales bacterium]